MKTLRNIMFILIFPLLLVACSGNNGNSGSEIIRRVKIEPVCKADSLLTRTYPGIVREANEVNLAFRVAGPIKKILIKEGDFVKAGQLIAQMDTRDYEVQLQAAQAQYDQVKAEADRVIELHSRQSISNNDYDKAITGMKMVDALLKNARDQLNDTRLLAPVSGYIQKVNFLENELVDAGMPVASMLDMGHYQVEVDIPVSLYVNRAAIVSFSGMQSDISKEEFPLQLLSYSKKANNNQLYKLQLRINPANQPKLAPGMDLQVKMFMQNETAQLACIPLNALFNEDGKTFVWLFKPDGTVKKQEVITGKLTGDGRIRITQGLEVDELIVVAGVNLLHENEKVEPLEPVSKTNIGGLL